MLGEIALAGVNVVLNNIAIVILRIGRMQLTLLLRQTSLTKNLTLLFIIKILKNAWVTAGRNINITALLLDTLNFNQMVAVAAHEIAHLKISSSNHLEVDQVGVDYLIKTGMHKKEFLTLLYWMQGYCMDNHDDSCSAYYTYLVRIEQIENSMSATDWRLALPDLENLLKVD